MKHYSSVIVGHITMDRNVDHLDNEIRSPGGAVIFSSASAYALGHNVLAVTKVAKPDQERLSAFTLPEENILCIDCESSSNMYNRYFTPDKERRKCVCTSVGTPFEAEDIPEDVTADIFHFAGLVYGDFTNDMITRSTSVHRDSPSKNIGVGCHALLQGSSHPRNQTQVSCVAGRFFTI